MKYNTSYFLRSADVVYHIKFEIIVNYLPLFDNYKFYFPLHTSQFTIFFEGFHAKKQLSYLTNCNSKSHLLIGANNFLNTSQALTSLDY